SMVAAGEAAGALEIVLERLHQYLQKQQQLKSQISTAMIYPAVLASFSLLMVIMLLGFVVPSLEAMFEDREVNTLTAAVLGLSRFLSNYWFVYIPMLALIGGGAYYQMRTPRFRLWWQAQSLRIPGIRGLVMQAALARYCRTMATLLEGGLTLVEAMDITGGVLKNATLEAVFDRIRQHIVDGSSLSRELSKQPLIPQMMTRMLAVGEETGSSAAMFGRVADIYEQDVEKNLGRVTALAQPVILVFMGLLVGTVLLAVLLPLLDISGFAG
ncbi:MAG: type II secretion system F family protein, partial [Chlamydiia bacterium]|nr:type II secretion system F family protein [Chlamydiia bacterium]